MKLSDLRSRLQNPLDWDPADRCFLAAVFVLPFTAWYALFGWWAVLRPDFAPYLDRHFAKVFVLPLETVFVIPAWLGIAVIARSRRGRCRADGPLVHAVMQLFFGWFGFCSYCFGISTSLYPAIILFAGTTVGLVLFAKTPVLLGIATFCAIVLGGTVASQIGLIPYAPLIRSAPFQDGHLELSWLIGLGGMEILLLSGTLGIIYFVIDRWHDREDKLARATDLISRYIAAQVTQQILAGNYSVIDKHDRRKLTLFFSDIKDFSEIADHVEPEDLSRLLNEYLSEMGAIAQRHGGTIDKFIGDAVMVFFGAPMATEDRDHALRAVRMASEMQVRVRELSAKWAGEGLEHPFEVRMGINSGVASVGNFGSKERLDYTAIGRQVNLAARLQVNCEPGSILLSHSTWVLIQQDIPCVPKGEIQVKGIHRPVKVYEVVEAAEPGFAPRSPAITS